ncbi:MAG: YkgJ family cysteine cluster protein [Dissulfurimicrobium sp.]|uniref:YkgJ family cysteine cluster protein n=1 Tax=Dissulfurimicrobium sp. TaxID=2022436 RepID=UPI00404B36BF
MDLKRPLWPLFELVLTLYLISPYDEVEELVQELPDHLDISGIIYDNPSALLGLISGVFDSFVSIKKGRDDISLPVIKNEDGELLTPFDAIISLTKQKVLEYELEAINSDLCSPCGCTLCCTGPDLSARHEFFEIPLLDNELPLFELPVVDTLDSRSTTAHSASELKIDNIPFYKRPAAIYRWSDKYSLILPRQASCPHLNESGACDIYLKRPMVCRKPQIFPLVIEKLSGPYAMEERYIRRNTLLAVWDCPYVKRFKAEIIAYADYCALACIFKENKA